MNLHKQFIQLGREKNKIQYKLLNLIPEIFRTEIYKKYAKTIEGYAWRFAQIPESVVQKTLKLEKHLEDKPLLKAAISQVGIHKVAMLATIPEPDELLADKVLHMSKPAIQQLSKELRGKPVAQTITIQLDEEMTTLFLKLKKKYQGNNLEVMKKVLTEATKEESKPTPKKSPGISRYINKYTKQEALKESNNHCAYPDCNKPHDAFHHPPRFAKTKNHKNIKPLCKPHHEFAHNGLIQNETKPPQTWKLKLTNKLDNIDQLYRKYRQAGGWA